MIQDFDDAYMNSSYIPDGASYPARWAASAERFREHLPEGCTVETGVAYGAGERQRFDLFLPSQTHGGTPKGLAIFIHGGYWMRFSRSDWSHLAGGALQRGWAVAMPGYTLTPDVTIGAITSEVARAIIAIAARVDGPMHIAGHSAGGHLATRMMCEPSQLPEGVVDRVKQVISISGVHDLRPLMRTRMNETLKLTELEARNESPALRRPRAGAKVLCWVGAAERPEFIRQTDLLANIWHGLGADITSHHAKERHHFDVVDDLVDAHSVLTRCFAP
jgi:acetyl esterase/lipase